MPGKPQRLHFLGIAGHTMRGLARAAIKLGYKVTGTDEGAKSPGSDWLDQHKIKWWREASPAHLDGIDILVISGGTGVDHPEVRAAKDRQIPIQSYAEFVGELVASKRRIVVTGTHGKTTTTSLIAWLLEAGDKQPDFLVGIEPLNFDTSVRLTESPIVALEGDEYKASALDERSKFSFYRPDVAVATSLEMDHPDLFKNVDEIRHRFEEMVREMPRPGTFLFWAPSPELQRVAKVSAAHAQSYGEAGDWQARHEQFKPEGVAFDLYHGDVYHGHYAVPLYGRHNIDNATAAAVVALEEQLTPEKIQEGLNTFKGASRRFEIVSAPQSPVVVVDDYAHHPTEITAVIAAAKLRYKGRVLAIVRPHTYSRTKALLDDYRQAVATADLGFVTDIEGAREAHLAATVSGADIADPNAEHVVYEPDRSKLIERVVSAVKPGDVVLCMTVSGYENLAQELAERLKR